MSGALARRKCLLSGLSGLLLVTEQHRVLDGFKNGGSLFPQKPTVMFQITLVCGFMCLLTSNEIGMVVKFCNCPHCLNLETE